MAVRLANAGQQMGVVHPTLGDKKGEVEFNFLGIVKNTKNKDAYLFSAVCLLQLPATGKNRELYQKRAHCLFSHGSFLTLMK